MRSHGKVVPRFVSEPATGVQHVRPEVAPCRETTVSSPAPARPERFVSPAGPDRPPATLAGAQDVCFLASAETWDKAQELKHQLRSNAETTVVIYRRSRVRNRLRLWQVDPEAGAPPLRARTAVAFDLFRVAGQLLVKEKRATLAAAVAQVLDGFGQAPPPTNVDPR